VWVVRPRLLSVGYWQAVADDQDGFELAAGQLPQPAGYQLAAELALWRMTAAPAEFEARSPGVAVVL